MVCVLALHMVPRQGRTGSTARPEGALHLQGGPHWGYRALAATAKISLKKKKSLVPTCLLFHVLSSLYPNIDGAYMKMISQALSMCHKNV